MVAYLLYYLAPALVVGLSSFGVAFGQGIAGGRALLALSRQDLASGPARRAMLLGLVFIESGGIFALITALMFISMSKVITLSMAVAALGASIGLGVAAGIVGIASAFVVASAAEAIARQPFFAAKITSLMLITQMLLEAPTVFGFIIAFFIQMKISPTMTPVYGWQLGAAGVLMAFGALGPAIGQSMFAAAACRTVGKNTTLYKQVLSFSLITQALIETPVIFCLILSSMLIFKRVQVTPLAELISLCLATVFSFGIGSMGAAIGSGFVGKHALDGLARQPDEYPLFFRTALLCQTIIDTALIYSLIIAFLLLIKCL